MSIYELTYWLNGTRSTRYYYAGEQAQAVREAIDMKQSGIAGVMLFDYKEQCFLVK